MSCGLAIAAALILTDPVAATAPPAPVEAVAPPSVAGEPLFMDIVERSRGLKAVVDGWIADHAANADGFMARTDFAGFRGRAEALAALDMEGHVNLRERGVDGDLKCILRGIAEDMPKRLDAVETAPSEAERAVALSELAYLLNDNVEVITAPPQPAA